MNKTRKIKEIIGTVLKEKGFEYIRCEKKIVYDFKRQIDGVEQHVYVQQHNIVDPEYKIILYTTAKGHGMKEIGNILPEYESKEYWKAETDEEFISLMNWFADFLKDYGLDELGNMLVDKPDSFETPERKEWFKEHRQELFEKYEGKYHVMSEPTTYDQLMKIDKILLDNREPKEDEKGEKKIQELWLGMAAILVEIVMKIPGISITYDTYHIEIHVPSKYGDWTFRPVYTVSQGWIRYHFNWVTMRDWVCRAVFPLIEELLNDEESLK